MAGFPALPGPPHDQASILSWLRFVHSVVNGAVQGKLNCTATKTLTANATTTTITDNRITPDSFIGLMPTTANAKNALSTLYVSARTNGSATLTHASDAATDKTFRYVIIG